jgi:hypothetical protein
MGLTSLEELEEIIMANRLSYEWYLRKLDDLPGVRVLTYDDKECNNNHQYGMAQEDSADDQVMRVLWAENVRARRYLVLGSALGGIARAGPGRRGQRARPAFDGRRAGRPREITPWTAIGCPAPRRGSADGGRGDAGAVRVRAGRLAMKRAAMSWAFQELTGVIAGLEHRS